ncbi:MAG: BrnA antitoxin family protein, partial [Rhodothermales bacterium]
KSRSDWNRVDSLSDEEIEAAVAEDPDAELFPTDWLHTADLIVPEGEKERITIRVDRDVVEYFRSKGSGYQTRMNAVLKAYVLSRRLKEK